MFKRLIALCLAAFAFSSASAQTWIPMPFDKDVSVDVDSIKHVGLSNTFSFWAKWSGRHVSKQDKKNGVLYGVQRLIVKCKPYVTTMQENTIFYTKDRIFRTSLTRTYDYNEYPPDSVGQSISEMICEYQEQGAQP